ncbi:autotransporter domain-containing protein [Polaromonas sp. YR568]|uniref:autotransporter outer membrane beta-barrel domain-containing protein n=1 Tax=Polaromonas sp. YR568 TaxID=1855301 RepID=UPI00398BEFEE
MARPTSPTFRASRSPHSFKKRSLVLLALPCSVLPWGPAWAQQCNGGATVTGTLAISANCDGGSAHPLNMGTGANLTVNAGVTVSNDAGSGRNGDPISVLSSATASTLTNRGTIATGQQIGVNVNGVLTSLVNSGTISSGVRRGLVITGPGGVIGTLTNTGSIIGPFSGITNNGGILQTFNNLQGAGNANGAVTYTGPVPVNYNIIINSPSTYGKFTNKDGVTGALSFGIYGTSTVAIGSYTGVLNNFTTANVTGATTGFYGGLNWALGLASGSTTVWNLVFSAPVANTNMTSGGTYSLAAVGVTLNPVFDGGTLVLPANAGSAQAFTLNGAGGTLATTPGGAANLSGVFSGAGGLTVNGGGTLALSGTNSYAGGTTVAAGTLSVSGNSPLGTGPAFVAAGATLMGTGTLRGALTVAGTLKPGHSPGRLAVNGTVTMNSGSTFQQDIAGTVQASAASPAGATGYYSVLNITGGQFVIQPNATLAPRLLNLFTPGEPGFGSTPYTPVLGDSFRVVSADGGIAGRFSTLAQPAGLAAGTQFVQFYNLGGSKSLDLAVIPVSYTTTLAAENLNTRSAAGALDRLAAANQSGTATAAQDALLAAAATRNAAGLPAFTRGLAGEVYAATLVAAPQAGLRMQQAVLAHLDDAGSAANPFAAQMGGRGSLLASAGGGAVPGLQLAAPGGDAMREGDGSSAAWGEVAYQRGRRSGDQGAGGFTHDLYQAVLGGDVYVRDGIKAGGGLALSNTDVSAGDGQGEGKLRQGALFAYARMPAASWVVDTLASWGVQSTQHTRTDVTGLTGPTAGLGGKTSGRDALLSAGLSRPTPWRGMVASPYARLTWQSQHRSAVDEGSAAAALRVDGFDAQGLRGVLGVTLASTAKHPLQEARTYRFNVGLGADSGKLLNPELTASLAGMPTTIRAPHAGNGFLQLGFYGTQRLSGTAFGYVGVSTESRRGSVQGSAQAGVRMVF